MRESLNSLSRGQINVDVLAALHPSCECESAETEDGCYGPVKGNEVVRYFLASPSDIGNASAEKLRTRPFNSTSLKRAFTTGLSVSRLAYATSEELEKTAAILFAFQASKSPQLGGVLAVIDFPVEAVRVCPAPHAPFCVLETPLDPLPNGQFDRPSHADIVNSVANLNDESKKACREIIHNQIKLQGTQTNSEHVTDCNLLSYLPSAIRDAL